MRAKPSVSAAWVATTVILSAGSAAHADTLALSPAYGSGYVIANQATGPCPAPQVCTFVTKVSSTQNVPVPGVSALALDSFGAVKATLGPRPAIGSQGSAASLGGAVAIGSFNYYFEVVPAGGGSAPPTVPVRVTASGLASVASSGAAQYETVQAQLQIGGFVDDSVTLSYGWNPIGMGIGDNFNATLGGGFISSGSTIGNPSGESGGFNLNQIFSLDTNVAYEVMMSTEISLTGPASGMVSVDPLITPQLPGFNILLSSGVGKSPVAATPLPSTWLMMISGLAMLGFVGRRGRQWIDCVVVNRQSST